MTDDLIGVNVAGRLILSPTRRGLFDKRRLSIYQRAVGEAAERLFNGREGHGGRVRGCAGRARRR